MIRRGFGGSCLVLLLAACSPAPEESSGMFNLPSELSEVSGLTVAGPDSVFTHDDEYAIIYEFRLSDGHILRAFALDEPTLEGDFEGIATAGGRVFLVTSDGLIYSALPGENAERVSYRVYDSGVGPRCEVEGLSQAPEAGELLLLCKRFRNDNEEARLEIYRWKIGSERAEAEPFLSLPLAGLLDGDKLAEFRPSGLEWVPVSGRLYVVSARSRTVLVLGRAGRLVERHRLDATRHPETEGITLMPDGRLVLADEGSRTREGRLTAYRLSAEDKP
jgi:uncharacterized protein YjiK